MDKLGAAVGFPGDTKSVKEQLKGLAKAGYSACHFGGAFFLKSTTELKKISKILSDFPIEPFSAHNLLISPAPHQGLNSILPFQKEVFEKATILGVKYLAGHFGQCEGLSGKDAFNFEEFLTRRGANLEDYREEAVEVLKVLCQEAKKHSLSLTIENLPIGCLADLGTTAEDLLKIIKEVNEPNLGICFDSGHGFIAGLDLYREIIKAGGKLFDTHFHDNFGRISGANSINDLHQPVGIGRINWLDVIAALEKINFKNPVVFEMDNNPDTLSANKRNWEWFCLLYQKRFPKWPKF
ncbi:MAG: sugar phosphate isomerase/epimerase [Kiritimatiellia bacterium]|nr:sugar phosphate isomerase/epimerase [Kiritimatiellia bacterium]